MLNTPVTGLARSPRGWTASTSRRARSSQVRNQHVHTDMEVTKTFANALLEDEPGIRRPLAALPGSLVAVHQRRLDPPDWPHDKRTSDHNSSSWGLADPAYRLDVEVSVEQPSSTGAARTRVSPVFGPLVAC